MRVDWEEITEFMGYRDVGEMVHDLYVVKKLSMKEVSLRVGVSQMAIRHKMAEFGIDIRSPGGAVATPKKHYYLHLCDQRWIFSSTLEAIAKVMRMNPTYVMHYKRKVKGIPGDAIRTDTSVGTAQPSFD